MRISIRFAVLGLVSVGAALLTAAALGRGGTAQPGDQNPRRPLAGTPHVEPSDTVPQPQPGRAGQASRASLDRADVARFLDAAIEEQRAAHNLPGAAVVVVQHGAVVHARGYGHAEIEAERRFDAETSVFRTASVSKLFTATAVMQLVEQGLIDLDADVNAYLDFQVPATYPAAITMRHLLTHTAGFDERLLGSSASASRPEAMLTLRQSLTSPDAPPRVRPPGQVISYSNHGIALAGYIVERVSGKPFARYVDEHIHAPLGMTRSTFTEPLPPHLERDRVRGYVFRKGRHEALPIMFENSAPAGSHFSTGADIARFMLAHLAGGAVDGARIFGGDAARLLHAQAFTHHPRLPGWTLGFTEYHRNGWRAIGHGGDLPGAHSMLILVPEAELGLFIHFNGEWPVSIDNDPRQIVVQRFRDAFLPARAGGVMQSPTATRTGGGPGEPAAAFARRESRSDAVVAGNYRYSRHAKTSIEKLLVPNSLFRLHVAATGNGTIRVRMPLGLAAVSEWVEVEPLLYKRTDGDEYLAFGTDGRGRVTQLFPTLIIPMAFERVRWYESEAVLLGLLAFSAFSFFGVAAAWPAGALARRLRDRPVPGLSTTARRRRAVARALGLLGSSVILSLGAMSVQAVTTGNTSLLPLQPVLAGAAGVCGLLAVALGYSNLRAWQAGEGTVLTTLGYAGLTVAGLAFTWQMAYWNVISL